MPGEQLGDAPRASCLVTGVCAKAIWTRREWGELVCETCHPTPVLNEKTPAGTHGGGLDAGRGGNLSDC